MGGAYFVAARARVPPRRTPHPLRPHRPKAAAAGIPTLPGPGRATLGPAAPGGAWGPTGRSGPVSTALSSARRRRGRLAAGVHTPSS